MKVNIVFTIANTPKGGGNQFLRTLKDELFAKELYSRVEDADVILFNSHQDIEKVIKIKRKYPEKLFIHRIDGPIRLYNKMSDRRDFITNITNRNVADATVYQSEWSKMANLEMGLEQNKYEKIIPNAVDCDIFNRQNKSEFSKNRKVRLIASSWSSNINKGFETYKYLDEHLDFSKYEMTFVGNSPIQFRNIRMVEPQASRELAKILKQQDIYITASKKDPCSNSLIEALACGLPAVCYKDGGHPEILKEAGVLFSKEDEIPALLNEIVENYDIYQGRIQIKGIADITAEYVKFFHKILNESEGKRKKLTKFGEWEIAAALWKYYYLK